MKQLDYIKEKFLDSSYVLDFSRENNEFSQRYVDFQNTLHETNDLIKKSTSVEEVTTHIKEAQRRFMLHWNFIHESPDEPSVEKMRALYYSAHLNDPDKWIGETLANYEIKKSNRFFELVSKGMKFVNQKIPKEDLNFSDISEQASQLITKYNLNSIDLHKIKPHKASAFLKNLDSKLEEVCQSMGITPDVIGIHGTVSFSATPHTEAFFSPDKKSISIGGLMQNSSTILHEWIHALDYHVGDHIRPKEYASQIKDSVYIDDSSKYESFQSIKKITQEIFSSSQNIPLIDSVKKELLKEGTSKFFSDLLGYDFYTLPVATKELFHDEIAFKAVNNYFIQPASKNNQNKLIELLAATHTLSEEVVHKIKNPTEASTYLKSYFDSINENIWGKESFYHLSSRLSKYGLQFNNFVDKAVMKGVHFFTRPKIKPGVTNLTDSDYLIQPTEMLARYFESQVFPKSTLANNIIGLIAGVQMYKIGVDKNFEDNKDKMIESVFGKDKILKNISQLRKNSFENSHNKPQI